MEDLVTFEIAKKLKEKGFDYPCVGHYVNNQLYIAHYYNAYHSDKDESPDAPTISQVLKWLRDEKKLHICISLGEFSDWVYDISKIEGNVFCEAMDDFHSYEEAALAGVNYCLDNLI